VEEEIGDFVGVWAVPVFAAATIGLWFLDRPGPWYRWKIAALAGTTAAGLGLVLSQVITHFWQRPRPFVARRMGAAFLAAATLIAVTRVIAGLHYPGDIFGGAAIGFLSAALVYWLAGDYLAPVVRLVSKVTDPLVTPAWRALDRAKNRRRGRPVS
jgi:membrane-associated phospholipid phosphatase